MIFKLQYKSKRPVRDGNTYTKKLTAATTEEAWEIGIMQGRGNYRLISVTPTIRLIEGGEE